MASPMFKMRQRCRAYWRRLVSLSPVHIWTYGVDSLNRLIPYAKSSQGTHIVFSDSLYSISLHSLVSCES